LDDVPYKASATLDLPAGILLTYLSGPEPDCGPAVFNLPVVALGEGDIVCSASLAYDFVRFVSRPRYLGDKLR
jgi:hypothetical protein